jgi:Skp family chaperone for outer membrane proteins
MRYGALLFAAGLLAAPAAAADLPPARIAVLDYQAVLRDSLAAQQVRRQVDKYREDYQEEMSREEEQLRGEEQELKRLRGAIPAATFDTRRRNFERRVQEAQRRAQEQARSLDQVFNQAMSEVRRQMAPIVADLTKELGFNLVVDKSQILFAARAIVISEEVAAALNEKLPSLEVARPGP